METIGERVRRLREAKGISGAAFARLLKIPVTTLNSLELGKARRGTHLHRIAAALGVTATYLETGKESREPAPLSQSHLMRLDALMIAETHRALREIYEEDGRVFDIEKEPARFMRVYELRASMNDNPAQEDWVHFGRKLAVVMGTQGAENDGRRDGSAPEGTHKKRVAR